MVVHTAFVMGCSPTTPINKIYITAFDSSLLKGSNLGTLTYGDRHQNVPEHWGGGVLYQFIGHLCKIWWFLCQK